MITGKPPAVNHHFFSAGKRDQRGIAFSHVQKNHFQVPVKPHPVNPVGHIDDDQKNNDRKADFRPLQVPGKKGKKREKIKKTNFK